MPTLESIYGEAHDYRRLRPAVEVSTYSGESALAVAATQLGSGYTRAQASRIVNEWVDFFTAGPTPITELHFRTRTPKRLFEALASQVQLQALFVKWGDYDDLTPLKHMRSLTTLCLGGASQVKNLEPLRHLTGLRRLQIESLLGARDASPLGSLTGITHLALGGNWMTPRRAHIESLDWLPRLRNVRHLLLHTLAVEDLDYTPLLRLERLEAVGVMRVQGMRPSFEELKHRLPWAE